MSISRAFSEKRTEYRLFSNAPSSCFMEEVDGPHRPHVGWAQSNRDPSSRPAQAVPMAGSRSCLVSRLTLAVRREGPCLAALDASLKGTVLRVDKSTMGVQEMSEGLLQDRQQESRHGVTIFLGLQVGAPPLLPAYIPGRLSVNHRSFKGCYLSNCCRRLGSAGICTLNPFKYVQPRIRFPFLLMLRTLSPGFV